MRPEVLIFLWLGAFAVPDGPPPGALQRLSEVADSFALEARLVTSREVLEQQALLPGNQSRLRLGEAALRAPVPQWQSRSIVSEYGFSVFHGALHEFRQVVSADGRRRAAPEKARAVLTRGVSSDDDRLKQQMLRDFEQYGLSGAAYDFGQLILLFQRQALANFEFAACRGAWLGADQTLLCDFRQNGGEQALTIFERGKAERIPLAGSVWFRTPDWLPLRIRLVTERTAKKRTVRDEATVDYTPAGAGGVLPASVVHRQFIDQDLVVQNYFHYSTFRRFSVDSKIDFDAAPADAKTNP